MHESLSAHHVGRKVREQLRRQQLGIQKGQGPLVKIKLKRQNKKGVSQLGNSTAPCRKLEVDMRWLQLVGCLKT